MARDGQGARGGGGAPAPWETHPPLRREAGEGPAGTSAPPHWPKTEAEVVSFFGPGPHVRHAATRSGELWGTQSIGEALAQGACRVNDDVPRNQHPCH